MSKPVELDDILKVREQITDTIVTQGIKAQSENDVLRIQLRELQEQIDAMKRAAAKAVRQVQKRGDYYGTRGAREVYMAVMKEVM